MLEHVSSCNNYDTVKQILTLNKQAFIFTHRNAIRTYNVYNANTFPNFNQLTGKYTDYETYDHVYRIYHTTFPTLNDCILAQRDLNNFNCVITYPFNWCRVVLNTRNNLYNFHEYELINHPRNHQVNTTIFNINMKLIDIDGTKANWYDKLLTENNINFNK